MADRGRRFDWSVIEEAGKAHGFDMAAALQESHRVLLIGDHFQLPPFNADRLRRLLNEPLRVRKAIQIGAKFAPGLVDASMVEDEDELEPFDDRCRQWRDMVTLFDIIFRKSTVDGTVDGPAVTLDEQHRMHPDIAELIGRIFYPDGKGGTIIKSPKETRDKFDAPPPFLFAEGSWMPQQRIVWYDVPWVQKQEFSEGEIDGLFASRVEVEAVVEILEQFRPKNAEACELQILSPYNDQIKEIKSCVEEARKNGRLGPMFAAPFHIKAEKRLGATVDEFQGSEADVVIVSLVRNNALVPWKSVGFLKEANRMNVLLSRARHKLIIVGSWDFFMSRCDAYTSVDSEYSYLRKMMLLMEEFERTKRLTRCSGAK